MQLLLLVIFSVCFYETLVTVFEEWAYKLNSFANFFRVKHFRLVQ